MVRKSHPDNAFLADTRKADRLRKIQRYWLPVRLSDWVGGRHDGKRGLPEQQEITQFQHRLSAQSREGTQAVLRTLERQSAPLVQQLFVLTDQLTQAENKVAAATDRLNAQPAEPSVDQLTARGPAEEGDDDATLAARARRRHAAETQALRAEVTHAEEQRQAVTEQLKRVRADLESLHVLACAQAIRIVEHHQRRTHVYLRALIRRHPDRSRVVDLYDRQPIEPPQWATQGCRWTTAPTAPASDTGPRLSLA